MLFECNKQASQQNQRTKEDSSLEVRTSDVISFALHETSKVSAMCWQSKKMNLWFSAHRNFFQESPQEEEIDEPDESDGFVKVEHEMEEDLDVKMENFLDANEELSNDLPDGAEVEECRPVKKAKYEEQDEDDMFFTSMFKMIKSLPPVEQAKIKLTLGNAVLQAKLRVHEAESNVSPHEPPSCSSSTTWG